MIVKFYNHIYDKSAEYGDLTPLLSHQADISIVQSIKDVGKSYPAMKLLKKVNENGGNAVWLRWDEAELETAIGEFVRDGEYVRVKLGVKKHGAVLKNKANGGLIYCLGVKYAQTFKGLDLPDLRWIVYDEFIPEYYSVQTRKIQEFDRFMILLTALWRKNHPRVLLISNTIDWYNSYFHAWNIEPFPAGKIRVAMFDLTVESDGIPVKKTYKIAVENMKPSPKMIARVMQSEGLRGNQEQLQRYIENYYKNEYTLIEVCPDLKLPLGGLQIYYNNSYYTYRVYKGTMYWCKVAGREIPTEVCRRSDMGNLTAIRPNFGRDLEDMVNAGLCKFDTGYTYNAVMGYAYEVRNPL